ncbi:hypothetical protein [Shewanella phaeophyticola]|uniref:hypothetical protein n=1 Tax=Shewanella phaeophyticola TaxID=2978345 RepID=UPI0028F6F7F5|nr:hypothetical protein [Shewanella sp. KJ10-1]
MKSYRSIQLQHIVDIEVLMGIDIIHHEDEHVIHSLTSGLRQFNVEHLGNESTQPLTIVARNDDGDVIGGVGGRIHL